MATYEVMASKAETLTKKIKRILNKCDKDGVSYSYNVSEPYDKMVEVEGDEYSVKFVAIEIECYFKKNGWSVLGSVSRKGGIVQCYFDDASLLKEYSQTDFHCDHCHKNVYRNSVVLLQNEQGDKKLVGSTCVKEFTRGLDGELVVAYAALMDSLKAMSDIDEDEEFFEDCMSHGIRMYSLLRVVSSAASLIRNYGYKSSSFCRFDETPTFHFILDTLNHYGKEVNDEDIALATKAIEWVKSLPEEEYLKNSYMFNLHQICKQDLDVAHCSYEHFALLTSLIPTYNKAVAVRLKSDKKKSEHVGQIKDKLNLTVQLIAKPSFDSAYGTCYIYIMKDENENIFVWKTNKYLSAEAGAVLKLKGTVKEHSEYRNEKQTVLTRCSVELLKDVIKEEEKEANNKAEDALSEFLEYCEA